MTKWVYSFGDNRAEGNAGMRDLLGGKGANLAEMSNLQLPVPPGFTITTEVCTHYHLNHKSYPEDLEEQVETALAEVAEEVGAGFGDAGKPLFVSVRRSARASMPGMMDTVLNLGLNEETVTGLAEMSGNACFAYNTYQRFMKTFGQVILGIEEHLFREPLQLMKDDRGVELDSQLTADDWRELVSQYEWIVEEQLRKPFPQNVYEQLWATIGACFASWRNQKAITYRQQHNIPEEWGTAVNVQAMIFGNMGDDCGTGVASTRVPSTGENRFFGQYLTKAQGNDVVTGVDEPHCLTVADKVAEQSRLSAVEEAMPELFQELDTVRRKLETHYGDMQRIEFTVNRGKLWILQTQAGNRTIHAALKIAVDMCREGLINKGDAVACIDPNALDQLLHPTIDPNAEKTVIARGLPASPGTASGIVVFSSDEAETQTRAGADVILVKSETSFDDIHGMRAAGGILTRRGGMTSHAAIVARGMGRPCVVGVDDLRIDYSDRKMSIRGTTVKAGDRITIDGGSAEVMFGAMEIMEPVLSDDFKTLMGWADQIRHLRVRANAETPADARRARNLGAEGIGLCRTEHMFFEDDRIVDMRTMILADDEQGRCEALAKILPNQRKDFIELFEIMSGLPVTIRLLDAPLNDFLACREAELIEVAKAAKRELEEVRKRLQRMQETNPMLGLRGCQLALTYPEISEMQCRAIFEAAVDVRQRTGATVEPEIMIPLVATRQEIEILKAVIDRVAGEVAEAKGVEPRYRVGTMIELPRACLRAGEIVELAEFCSFGTNDLTQTTFGLSRDDASDFIKQCVRQGVVPQDPFISLDVEGVGELIDIACQRSRISRPAITLGICGEQGGDPASVKFCHKVGLDYVSCSPYRIPIARLAAAQAVLEDKYPNPTSE